MEGKGEMSINDHSEVGAGRDLRKLVITDKIVTWTCKFGIRYRKNRTFRYRHRKLPQCRPEKQLIESTLELARGNKRFRPGNENR